jgi:hypothetical protein
MTQRHKLIKNTDTKLNLLVVLHGYETWSHTLREERRLRVFYSRALRNIYGPTKYEVTVEWSGVEKTT